jgi:thymidine kinase
MIEGLHIDISSAKLKDMIEERANVHGRKVMLYKEKIDALEQESEIEDDVEIEETSVSVNPEKSLKRRLKEHRARYNFFMFMAEHLVPDETYRLSLGDLRTMEVIDRWM